MDETARRAELALLLEATAAPTPGNVSRERDLPDLSLTQFLAGSVGARAGLADAAAGRPIGAAFEHAVAGMAEQSKTNTQFGALMLLTPLVAAAGREQHQLTPAGARAIVAETTVADAVAFYRAFDHVDVRVPDPPVGSAIPDVAEGSAAEPVLKEHDLTLDAVLQPAATRGGVASELVGGFGRTFAAADQLASTTGSLPARAAAVHLELLAAEPDPLIATAHGAAIANTVCDRAAALTADPDRLVAALDGADIDEIDTDAIDRFAEELVERGINPGATADLLAGGLFVALERKEVSL
ncbi:MAG: triphosphoribosyl-dephospho-CoA synthase [Salinarchaeum sp.]